MKSIYFLSFLFTFVIIFTGCNRPLSVSEQSESDTSTTKVDSLDILTVLIRQDPENPEFHYRRALQWMSRDNFDSAMRDIGVATRLDSTEPAYYLALADIYLNRNKLQNSVAAVDRALELEPRNIKALLKQAEIHLVVGNHLEALKHLDRVIELDDLNDKAIFLRGVVFMETGDTSRAVRNFQKAIDINQEYMEAYMQLGILYSLKKNRIALDYFNSVLNMDPDNLEAKYSIAIFYQEAGEYENAMSAYGSILVDKPDFYIAHYNMGYIELVYRENYEDAIEHFTEAIGINPEYADAYYNRGLSYEMLGDVQNSYENYKEAVTLQPNHPKALEGLKRIDDHLE